MRPLLLVALALFLAACDSGASSDAVVGTWRLDAMTETVRVTSRTAQAVPDISATPTIAVTASGARAANLDVVISLSGAAGFTELFLATDEDWHARRGAALAIAQITGSAQATLTDAATGEQFSGFFGTGAVLVRQGGRFTIPPLTLNGAGTVTVSGTVTYPEIRIEPNQPIEVQPYAQPLEGTLALTFEAGGQFLVAANGPGGTASQTGTWERLDAGRIRLTASSGGAISSGVFEVSSTPDALVLKGVDLSGTACNAACVRRVEPEVFTEAGSLSAVSFITTLRFRPGR